MKVPPPAPDNVLPDLIRPGLKVIFCGTAAGPVSAARRQYYAHPQNRFWKTLYEIGLTPYQFSPSEYAKLYELQIGLTDIAKHVSGLDKDIPSESLGEDACFQLRSRILANEPRHLAFTSLLAGRKFLRTSKATFGKQPDCLGITQIWILPSPSPAALWNWDIKPWTKLAQAVSSIP